MANPKHLFVCSECGTTYPKWQGQCSACKAWNTLVEETVSEKRGYRPSAPVGTQAASVIPINRIPTQEDARIDLQDPELNRVLGGGLVPGSFILLGGEPGIGKSTLVLQTVLRNKNLRTLYVSGEESAHQIRMRAERIGFSPDVNCHIYCETDLDRVLSTAQNQSPDLLVVDSIQTVTTSLSESSPGSVSQVRECATLLLQFAKTERIPVLVVGHITKEGSLAGPKVLEHIVDTVLQFEGDKHYLYRILRCSKNRFGSTDELGIYEMYSGGLRVVSNPSEHLVSGNRNGLSGVTVAVATEGVRPLLIETQALVSSAVYNNPQRSATGYDLRRLNMLLAVLEKRAGFKLIQKDVFLNITGGIRISDPATDLAILCAVLSSNLDIAVDPLCCLTGEVGLAGEVRPVSRIEQRVSEAARIGFTSVLVPADNLSVLSHKQLPLRVIPCRKVEDAFRALFQFNHP